MLGRKFGISIFMAFAEIRLNFKISMEQREAGTLH